MNIDRIRKHQVDEVRALRRPNRARLVQYVVLCALFASFVSILPGSRSAVKLSAMEASAANHQERFQATMLLSVDWLSEHGYGFELALFEAGARVVSNIFSSVSSTSVFFPVVAYVSEGLIRILFILIASFRFWVLCIGLGIFAASKGFRPYTGDDLLGETGIDKLFYSGIRADLRQITSAGAPDQLVTNLATLKKSSRDQALTSSLIVVLKRQQAYNETSLELVRHISAFPELPYFAPAGDDSFRATKELLVDVVAEALDNVLTVIGGLPCSNGKNQFQADIFRIVQPFADAFKDIGISEVAVLFLSLQAGKAMGYLKEGNRWVQRSSFINLNARSVLHSVSIYKEEFDYDQRQRIRQALVYAKRFSVFGPVRLPIELTGQARALRQLAEGFLAPPSELVNSFDDIELHAWSVNAYKKFEQRWFQKIEHHQHSNQHRELFESTIVTESGLVCVDVAFVVSVMDEVIEETELHRLEELVAKVSQTQNLRSGVINKNYPSATDVEPSKGPLPQYQKIFLPLSFTKIKELGLQFGIAEAVLMRWSIYRNIFNCFGWLSRQVGTMAVPEESCCYIVFTGAQWSGQANALRLLGKKGMVPFRSTAFEQRFGKNWRRRFSVCDSATIADDGALFERLLTGYDPLQDLNEE